MAGAALVACLLYFVLVVSLWALFSLTRRSARPERVAAPFDTSVCNCVARRRIDGDEAEPYATDHLASSGRQLTDGVGIFSCPVTDVPWLWFGQDVVPGRSAGALVRVSPDAIDDPNRMMPGQYL